MNFGDYTSAAIAKHTPPAHDEGERHGVGQIEPPPVEWGRAYGDDGRTLAEEAAALLAEGYAPHEAAQELVWRYGRQVRASGDELAAAASGEVGA